MSWFVGDFLRKSYGDWWFVDVADDTDVPGEVDVAGTTGLAAMPLVPGGFTGFDDVLVVDAIAGLLPGAEPALGPGIFWHGGSQTSAATNENKNRN